MKRPFNAAYNSMAENLRDLCKAHNIDVSMLTNEQLYNVRESAGVASDNDEQEAWFLEDIKTYLNGRTGEH